jgi:signal transduction histidine kinase
MSTGPSEIDENFPEYCLGDPVRLRQVSTNLVSNAIKFTDSGSITVTTGFCDPPEGETHKLWAITKVQDTGIGIRESALSIIFDRFSQADATVTRRFGGTGLGLAICKQLVASMGGQIGVDSEVGKGTCFWFKLPIFPVDKDGKPLNS